MVVVGEIKGGDVSSCQAASYIVACARAAGADNSKVQI